MLCYVMLRPAIRENKKSFVIQAERFETQRERQ